MAELLHSLAPSPLALLFTCSGGPGGCAWAYGISLLLQTSEIYSPSLLQPEGFPGLTGMEDEKERGEGSGPPLFRAQETPLSGGK